MKRRVSVQKHRTPIAEKEDVMAPEAEVIIILIVDCRTKDFHLEVFC